MANHAHTTPPTQVPLVRLPNPRKEVEDALYDVGIITDIIAKLASLMISTTDAVCGTSFAFLAEQLEERHERLQEHISVGRFGREA